MASRQSDAPFKIQCLSKIYAAGHDNCHKSSFHTDTDPQIVHKQNPGEVE